MKLFAYGTLMRRHRLEALCGRRLEAPERATLRGFGRHDTGHGYPMVLPEEGAEVDGLLWEVAAEDLPQIDHYEGTDEQPPYYRRAVLGVQTSGGTVEAVVYIGEQAVLERLARGQEP